MTYTNRFIVFKRNTLSQPCGGAVSLQPRRHLAYRLRLASFDSRGKLVCSRSTGHQLVTLEKDQEYVVMNLDSRLLTFPLYVCCNFLYTSPHSDHRPDCLEQESSAHTVSWCHERLLLLWCCWDTDTNLYVQSTEIFPISLMLGISSACYVTLWGVWGEVFCICVSTVVAHWGLYIPVARRDVDQPLPSVLFSPQTSALKHLDCQVGLFLKMLNLQIIGDCGRLRRSLNKGVTVLSGAASVCNMGTSQHVQRHGLLLSIVGTFQPCCLCFHGQSSDCRSAALAGLETLPVACHQEVGGLVF